MADNGDPETDNIRMEAARSIKPGWTPIPLVAWEPHKAKPQLEHLVAEAQRRLPGLRCKNWPAPKLVTWLSENTDDGTAVTFGRVSHTGDESGAGNDKQFTSGAAAGTTKGSPSSAPSYPFKATTVKRSVDDGVRHAMQADEQAEAAAKRRRAEAEAEAAKDALFDSKMAALQEVITKLAKKEGGETVGALLRRRQETLEAEISDLLREKEIAKKGGYKAGAKQAQHPVPPAATTHVLAAQAAPPMLAAPMGSSSAEPKAATCI